MLFIWIFIYFLKLSANYSITYHNSFNLIKELLILEDNGCKIDFYYIKNNSPIDFLFYLTMIYQNYHKNIYYMLLMKENHLIDSNLYDKILYYEGYKNDTINFILWSTDNDLLHNIFKEYINIIKFIYRDEVGEENNYMINDLNNEHMIKSELKKDNAKMTINEFQKEVPINKSEIENILCENKLVGDESEQKAKIYSSIFLNIAIPKSFEYLLANVPKEFLIFLKCNEFYKKSYLNNNFSSLENKKFYDFAESFNNKLNRKYNEIFMTFKIISSKSLDELILTVNENIKLFLFEFMSFNINIKNFDSYFFNEKFIKNFFDFFNDEFTDFIKKNIAKLKDKFKCYNQKICEDFINKINTELNKFINTGNLTVSNEIRKVNNINVIDKINIKNEKLDEFLSNIIYNIFEDENNFISIFDDKLNTWNNNFLNAKKYMSNNLNKILENFLKSKIFKKNYNNEDIKITSKINDLSSEKKIQDLFFNFLNEYDKNKTFDISQNSSELDIYLTKLYANIFNKNNLNIIDNLKKYIIEYLEIVFDDFKEIELKKINNFKEYFKKIYENINNYFENIVKLNNNKLKLLINANIDKSLIDKNSLKKNSSVIDFNNFDLAKEISKFTISLYNKNLQDISTRDIIDDFENLNTNISKLSIYLNSTINKIKNINKSMNTDLIKKNFVKCDDLQNLENYGINLIYLFEKSLTNELEKLNKEKTLTEYEKKNNKRIDEFIVKTRLSIFNKFIDRNKKVKDVYLNNHMVISNLFNDYTNYLNKMSNMLIDIIMGNDLNQINLQLKILDRKFSDYFNNKKYLDITKLQIININYTEYIENAFDYLTVFLNLNVLIEKKTLLDYYYKSYVQIIFKENVEKLFNINDFENKFYVIYNNNKIQIDFIYNKNIKYHSFKFNVFSPNFLLNLYIYENHKKNINIWKLIIKNIDQEIKRYCQKNKKELHAKNFMNIFFSKDSYEINEYDEVINLYFENKNIKDYNHYNINYDNNFNSYDIKHDINYINYDNDYIKNNYFFKSNYNLNKNLLSFEKKLLNILKKSYEKFNYEINLLVDNFLTIKRGKYYNNSFYYSINYYNSNKNYSEEYSDDKNFISYLKNKVINLSFNYFTDNEIFYTNNNDLMEFSKLIYNIYFESRILLNKNNDFYQIKKLSMKEVLKFLNNIIKNHADFLKFKARFILINLNIENCVSIIQNFNDKYIDFYISLNFDIYYSFGNLFNSFICGFFFAHIKTLFLENDEYKNETDLDKELFYIFLDIFELEIRLEHTFLFEKDILYLINLNYQIPIKDNFDYSFFVKKKLNFLIQLLLIKDESNKYLKTQYLLFVLKKINIKEMLMLGLLENIKERLKNDTKKMIVLNKDKIKLLVYIYDYFTNTFMIKSIMHLNNYSNHYKNIFKTLKDIMDILISIL